MKEPLSLQPWLQMKKTQPTLNSEEATAAPATTANEEDITLSGAKIEMLASLQMKKHSYQNTSCSQWRRHQCLHHNADATDEIPYDAEGLDEETRAMLNTQIEPSTFSGYSSMNIRQICFFQYICEKLLGIINPDLMENLVVADC